MQFLNHLLVLGQTQIGSVLTLLCILVALGARRLLPQDRRSQSIQPLVFLLLALGLGVAATGALKLGAYTVWGILSFLDLLSLIIGLTSLLSLLLLDLALARTRFQIPTLIRSLLQMSVILLIVLTILYQRGLDPLSLLTTSAVLTAVVGLALQSTIANLFAGLSLHFDRALGIGDWVQMGAKIGRIAEIGWRSTALRTEDGDLLIVPNGRLLDTEVANLSRPDTLQRMEIHLGLHYRHPPNEVKHILLTAARGAPGVLLKPEPECLLTDFAESAITYKLRYWIQDYALHTRVESEVRTRVWYAAQRASLEIPFPTRTLVLSPSQAETSTFTPDVLDHNCALEKTELFTPLSPEDRAALASHIKVVLFSDGENLLDDVSMKDSFYIIESGEVTMSAAGDAMQHTVLTLRSGDVLCRLWGQHEETSSACYTAKSDTRCLLIDQVTLAALLSAHPQIAEELSSVLASRAMALNGERQERSAEALAQQSAEMKQRLLARIRWVFWGEVLAAK